MLSYPRFPLHTQTTQMAEMGRERAENVMEGARETVQGAQERAGEMYENARRSGEQVRLHARTCTHAHPLFG